MSNGSVSYPLDVKRETGFDLHGIVNMYCSVCMPTSCIASSQTTQVPEIGLQ